MDDLLDSVSGKNDYDWLITPPGTPRVPVAEITEKVVFSTIPKQADKVVSTIPKQTVARSSSVTRSRPYVPQTENGHATRSARSNSVTRPSVQSALTASNGRTSALNTSMSSVGSRPLTPSKAMAATISAKSTVPASRQAPPTRSSTPVKPRSSTPVRSTTAANTITKKPTPSQNSRPSTPTSQPRAAFVPSSSISRPVVSRSNSRSTTPTRQSVIPSSPSIGRSPSVGRVSVSGSSTSTGRTSFASGRAAPSSAPSSRPSSPSTRPRAPVRPLDIPDFPNETPPNLRTKIPDRAVSAGRTRPGMALSAKSGSNSDNLARAAPVVSNKKSSQPSAPARVPSRNMGNGHFEKPAAEEARKLVRAGTNAESTGFGRTISKNSLDMAIRHMDIRQSLGGLRGASLFPHSIRSSAASKGPHGRFSDPVARVAAAIDDRSYWENGSTNGNLSVDSNGAASHNGDTTDSLDWEIPAAKISLSDLDIYGSTHYDAMLLKEDTRNTSWLHSVDDRSDQSPVFDHRFEPFPEPFKPL